MQPALGKSGGHPIVFDPSLFAQYAPSQPNYSQPTNTVPSGPHGRGGFLTSIISELGGAGGAAGGAATGAALGSVVPGVGTVVGGLAGAIAGGFLGGTGGRLVENKVRDNKWNAGSALKEGAVDAALSGAGQGIGDAFRAGKAALKGGGAVEQLAKDSGVTLQQAPKVGMIQGAGEQLKAGAGGYGIGTRLGSNPLTAPESNRIAMSLDKLGVSASSPENMSKQLATKRANLEQILTKQYGDANSVVSKADAKNLADKIEARIARETGGGDTQFVQNQLNNLKKVPNTTGVWDFNKNLSNFTNYGAKADGKLVDREAAARIMKDETRKYLNAKVPGVKATNELYHGARDAEQLAVNQARDVKAGGLVGKIMNLSPVKAVEAKTGSTLETVGKASAGTGGPITKVAQQAKYQLPGNLIQAGTTGQPSNPNSSPAAAGGFGGPSPTNYDPSNPFGTGSSLTNDYATAQNGGAGSSSDANSPYSLSAVLSDISRDPKNANTYMSIYKMVNPNAGASTAPSAAEQKNNLALSVASSGLKSINQAYQFAGGGQGATGLVTHIPVVGQYVAGGNYDPQKAAAFNQTRIEVATQLATALTGSSRPAEQVIEYYLHSLPNIQDRPEVAQYKLEILQNELQNRTASSQSVFNGGSPTSNDMLTNALLGAQ